MRGGRGRGVVRRKGGWSGCEIRIDVLMMIMVSLRLKSSKCRQTKENDNTTVPALQNNSFTAGLTSHCFQAAHKRCRHHLPDSAISE